MLCSAKEIIEELSGFSIVPDATAVKTGPGSFQSGHLLRVQQPFASSARFTARPASPLIRRLLSSQPKALRTAPYKAASSRCDSRFIIASVPFCKPHSARFQYPISYLDLLVLLSFLVSFSIHDSHNL
ncbi:hypothetical protein PO124_04455 [Bacillus licheniformis]|nr:hypothetical protein [Bacillus licheniformis]